MRMAERATRRAPRHPPRSEESGALPLDLFPADATAVDQPFRARLRRCYTFPAQGGVLFTAETVALERRGGYAEETTALLARPDDTSYAIPLPPTYLHLPDQSTWSSLGYAPAAEADPAAMRTSKVPLARPRKARRWRASIAAACVAAGTALLLLGWRTFLL
jgi:hypothetical protein